MSLNLNIVSNHDLYISGGVFNKKKGFGQLVTHAEFKDGFSCVDYCHSETMRRTAGVVCR